MNKFEDMQAFIRIVEAGSLTKAAHQMGVAKSAVSRRLKDMERRLGTQLLIRSTRRQTLSEAGEILYESAKLLIARWDEVEQSIGDQDQDHELSGRIRISLPVSFGMIHLSGVLTEFMQSNPEILFDLDFTDRKVDLVAEDFDLAIRIGNLQDSALIAKKITSIEFICAASPEYLATHGEPKTIDELRQHKELRFGHRDQRVWQYRDENGQRGRIELEPKVRATNSDFLMSLGLSGQGVMINPTFFAYGHLRTGQLVPIMRHIQWQPLNAYIIYPPNEHRSARVRSLADFIVSHFKGEPQWDKGW